MPAAPVIAGRYWKQAILKDWQKTERMLVAEIKSCYIGPENSPEQFIAEHFFLYQAKDNIGLRRIYK